MPLCLKAAASMRDYCPVYRYGRYAPRLRASRTVHFPNDVVFQDHIKQGDLEQVGRFIRARKVTLDTIYPSGMAALHEAVLTGNLDCVKLLVKYGADIHQRDENGWTPLHMACSDGYADIARYLLSLGASLEATTDDGEKPSDLIDPEYEDLVQLFGATALR
ncbi:protein phosphatase 1 regulatory subunit 27 [Neopelma chrysocephalum]|uniref:protein phosphatase 1 regulatory subunit 27 n=1 Tax=Neopelma chrysocephalum TaxID=114329 RepID=UPI000FCD4CC4|nr:protein phosphatase 1 regulatory subunit 27 [Neopelma chrysocephalum]